MPVPKVQMKLIKILETITHNRFKIAIKRSIEIPNKYSIILYQNTNINEKKRAKIALLINN
jgi:hypothetical protein